METYGHWVFLSKEAEEEWENAPDSVKKARSYILAEALRQSEIEIMERMQNKKSLDKTNCEKGKNMI